jgi:hypothetical protein
MNAPQLQLYEVCQPPHRPSPPLRYHVDFIETFTEKAATAGHLRGQRQLLCQETVRPRISLSHIDLPTITMSR